MSAVIGSCSNGVHRSFVKKKHISLGSPGFGFTGVGNGLGGGGNRLKCQPNINVNAVIIPASIARTKKKKCRWLLTPTQLNIHGQWWSCLATQRLHLRQCLLRTGRRTMHAVQKFASSKRHDDSRESMVCFWSWRDESLGMCPGSRSIADV